MSPGKRPFAQLEWVKRPLLTAKVRVYDSTTGRFLADYYVLGDISSYTIREVTVTLDGDGNVTAVTGLVPEGGSIAVSGETTTEGANKTNGYVASYSQTDVSDVVLMQVDGVNITGKLREDTVTNTLPMVSLYKINETDEVGKRYLKGAVFALEDANGDAVLDASGHAITFTSDDNGLLFADRHFSDGTYYFRETKAPDGYTILTHRVVMTVTNGEAKLKAEQPGTTMYENKREQGEVGYTFEVMNNPGVALPNAGGLGTWLTNIVGIALISAVIFTNLLQRRQARA